MAITVLQFRLKEVMTRQHNFVLKCIKFYRSFCKQSYDETTQACKKITKYPNGKKKFNFELFLWFFFLVDDMVITWQCFHLQFLTGCHWCLPSPAAAPSNVQCSLHQLPAGRPSCNSFFFFKFNDVHGVSEWQTTPGQWPWQTAAAALVLAGHTKLYSNQLVSLSLWLNAWWEEGDFFVCN